MPDLSSTYEILTGPAKIYFAAIGETFPDIDDSAVTGFTSLGETDGGVSITFEQTTEEVRVDQRTGPVKVTRSEEGIVITTNLVVASLENLATLMQTSVTEVSAGSGVPGTKTIGMYRGGDVTERAFTISGESAYGAYPSQYELPRGYISGNMEMAHTKDGVTVLPVEIHVLEDLSASSTDERFGRLVHQTAAAT